MSDRLLRESDTLCWSCMNAVPEGECGCSWSESLIGEGLGNHKAEQQPVERHSGLLPGVHKGVER